MFDSVEELLDKIRLGEETFLECKEVHFAGQKVSGPRRDSLADELAAFANGRGGVCLLGVEDGSREIVGIPLTVSIPWKSSSVKFAAIPWIRLSLPLSNACGCPQPRAKTLPSSRSKCNAVFLYTAVREAICTASEAPNEPCRPNT